MCNYPDFFFIFIFLLLWSHKIPSWSKPIAYQTTSFFYSSSHYSKGGSIHVRTTLSIVCWLLFLSFRLCFLMFGSFLSHLSFVICFVAYILWSMEIWNTSRDCPLPLFFLPLPVQIIKKLPVHTLQSKTPTDLDCTHH